MLNEPVIDHLCISQILTGQHYTVISVIGSVTHIGIESIVVDNSAAHSGGNIPSQHLNSSGTIQVIEGGILYCNVGSYTSLEVEGINFCIAEDTVIESYIGIAGIELHRIIPVIGSSRI